MIYEPNTTQAARARKAQAERDGRYIGLALVLAEIAFFVTLTILRS